MIALAELLGATRGSVNRWLQWYEADGIKGLETVIRPGPAPKLSDAQRDELSRLVEEVVKDPKALSHAQAEAQPRASGRRRRSR